MNLLRDIFRRRARSILTITGIGIGVFTLVVLGAVAENMNVLLKTSGSMYDRYITVVEAKNANYVGMSLGSRPLAQDTIEQLRKYPGVTVVSPQTNIAIDDEFTGIPPMILGTEAGSPDYAEFQLSRGRRLEPGERGVAILGTDLAKKRGLKVGDTIELRGMKFTVVGVFGRTYMTVTDASAYVPLADAQQIIFARLPDSLKRSVKPSDLVLQANVYGAKGENLDTLATRMGRDITGILASGPTKMKQAQGAIIALVNAIVWSVAVIALIVSTFSIVNTMTMAVGERTREIGVKRALGASRGRIGRDVIAESALLGALGGVGGIALGVVVAMALNAAVVSATGTSMLLITGRLVVGTLAFAVALGVLGGLWPARRASRLDPARALANA
jgi:putative ABC transport system permease protein